MRSRPTRLPSMPRPWSGVSLSSSCFRRCAVCLGALSGRGAVSCCPDPRRLARSTARLLNHAQVVEGAGPIYSGWFGSIFPSKTVRRPARAKSSFRSWAFQLPKSELSNGMGIWSPSSVGAPRRDRTGWADGLTKLLVEAPQAGCSCPCLWPSASSDGTVCAPSVWHFSLLRGLRPPEQHYVAAKALGG